MHLSDALCKRPNTAADLPAVCTQLTVHLERLHKVRPGPATRPPPSPDCLSHGAAGTLRTGCCRGGGRTA